MHLKEKYDQHKTDFDPAAWQNFNQFRKQQASLKKNSAKMNPKTTLYIISILSIALLISFSGILWLKNAGLQNVLNQSDAIRLNLKTDDANSLSKRDKKVSLSNQQQTNNELSNAANNLLLKETLTTQTAHPIELHESPTKIPQSEKIIASKLKKQRAYYENSNIENATDSELSNTAETAKLNKEKFTDHKTNSVQSTRNLSSNTFRFLNTNEKFLMQTAPTDYYSKVNESIDILKLNSYAAPSNSNSKLPTAVSVKLPKDLSTKNENNFELGHINQLKKTEALNTYVNKAIMPIQLIETFLETETQSIKKREQIIESQINDYKNSFKLNVNFIPLLSINGSIPNANPVKKRGYYINLDYRRELNKILSVGIGLDYSLGKDRNNPQLDLLDYETNAHAHLRLYLFFLNTTKNRLFLKGGTGLSFTDRVHSYYNQISMDEILRGIQESRYFYMGYTIEVAYERMLAEQFYVGAQVGISSGNDGFTYPGVSVGYNF